MRTINYFLIFALLIQPVSSFAGREEFFPSGTANNIFDEKIWSESENGLMMLLPKRVEEEKEAEVLPAVLGIDSEQEAAKTEKTNQKQNNHSELSTREQLLSKYGSPDEAQPITAHKDAPEPYKAFTEALAAGDEELAYAYARKFVRYQRELQEFQGKLVEVQGKAMLKEGMLAPDGWAMSDEYDETAHLLAKDLESANAAYELEMTPEAQSLLERARDEERLANEQKNKFIQAHLNIQDEEQEAQQARDKYAGRLRRSPSDKLELLLFVNVDDYRSEVMAGNLSQLLLENQEDQQLKISGLTIENSSGSSVNSFAKKVQANYRISNGSALAKQLGIKNSPSLVIISSATDSVFVETGIRSVAFLRELVK